MCKVHSFLDKKQGLIKLKGNIEADTHFNVNQFSSFESNMDVVVINFDDKWYAFDPEYKQTDI